MVDEGSDVKGSSDVDSTQASGSSTGDGTAASSGGGSASNLSLTAAGVYTENKIATHVVASIEGASSISSVTGVTVGATDQAQITSLDAAAAVSADLSGGASANDAVAIGIGIARNTIQDSVNAHVSGVTQISGSASPLTVLANENDSIDAISVAAALAVSASTGGSALGVAGGGSLADNLIGVSTTAYISSSTLGTSNASLGAVSVKAADTSSIDATVAAFAASVAVSLGAGSTGVAIGASLAHNRISDGTDLGDGSVDAYIATSTINAASIAVSATSQQSISALTAAAAVALSGGDGTGLGVSGAAVALNEINLSVNASIDGSAADSKGLPSNATTPATYNITTTGPVTVNAADASSIDALVAAAAVAGGFGGEDGFAVAIGVSFARNAITNPVNAAITNVKQLNTGGGAVQVEATEAAQINAQTYAVAVALAGGGDTGAGIAGGGAIAWNIIGVDTTANISGTTIGATTLAGDVIVTAIDSSEINAQVAAVAAAVGRRRQHRGRRRDRRGACRKRDRQRRNAVGDHRFHRHRQHRRGRGGRLFDPDHRRRYVGRGGGGFRRRRHRRRRLRPRSRSKTSFLWRSPPISTTTVRPSPPAASPSMPMTNLRIDAVDGAAGRFRRASPAPAASRCPLACRSRKIRSRIRFPPLSTAARR